ISGIDLAEANLNFAKGHDVVGCDWTCLTIRNADAVDVRTVRRAGIGDQQSSALVHFQRRMDFRNARVIQIEIVISSASDIQSPAAGNQRQRSFPQALRGADPRDEVSLVFVFLPYAFGSRAQFSLELLLLPLFLLFA